MLSAGGLAEARAWPEASPFPVGICPTRSGNPLHRAVSCSRISNTSWLRIESDSRSTFWLMLVWTPRKL